MSHRVSVDLLLNRRSRLEREKAMTAARCPKESRFGECLLNIYTKDDSLLCKNLNKINSEYRRMELKMKQLKQTFVRQSKFLNHEPLILVERPASPDARRRKGVMDTGADDPETLKLPGYMRPLRTRTRTPSTITTIDAFMVRAKKKRNVWEEAMDEKEKPTFISTVRPCSRLSRRELTEVQYGWSTHKAKIDQDCDHSVSPARKTPTNLPDDTYVFVTQLPVSEKPKSADVKSKKSVRFRDDGGEGRPASLPSARRTRKKRGSPDMAKKWY